jgi:hypothetical protein
MIQLPRCVKHIIIYISNRQLIATMGVSFPMGFSWNPPVLVCHQGPCWWLRPVRRATARIRLEAGRWPSCSPFSFVAHEIYWNLKPQSPSKSHQSGLTIKHEVTMNFSGITVSPYVSPILQRSVELGRICRAWLWSPLGWWSPFTSFLKQKPNKLPIYIN